MLPRDKDTGRGSNSGRDFDMDENNRGVGTMTGKRTGGGSTATRGRKTGSTGGKRTSAARTGNRPSTTTSRKRK